MKNLIILLTIVALFLSTKISAQNPAIKVSKISDSGTPMLFLPHIGCSSDMWKEIAEHYSKTNSCYLFDFAGFDTIPAIEELYTEKYISAISDYIVKNNLTRAILIGQNYGGFVAIKTAQNKTLNIKAIVVSDFYPKLSMVLDSAMTKEKMTMVKEAIKKSIIEPDSLTFASYQKQMGEGMNLIDTTKVLDFVRWQSNSDRNTLAETLSEQLDADLIPELETNDIPLLVFNTWYFAKTYQNKPISEATKSMEKMFPNSKNITFAITEDAKDFMAMDLPDWFIKEMDTFLNKIRK
ncbi:alpha/beta fold hydrolase [Aequorivita lipolytica]|uniref:Alpha/beta hydrolase n=1 Tax=Aequorivita lipolytica TaxID=153267 RepID=A0A5C6YLQ0_9FLAO|nr:alpha/beta hydrolase [Aequorivita lipolytica]TXD67846.1 alpha/beta hydrolase [Aequorivita lipolytica]SRX54008.1 hypothetical protein AEQU2_03033 [Aequorivita lipolytica]